MIHHDKTPTIEERVAEELRFVTPALRRAEGLCLDVRCARRTNGKADYCPEHKR